MGKQYELVGKKFTLSFQEYQRMWANIVAILLAYTFYINMIFIAKTYITNGGMRQPVIAQEGVSEEAYTSLKDKLQQEGDQETVTKEELEQIFAHTRTLLDTFTIADFPIDWTYFPHYTLQENKLQITASGLVQVSNLESSDTKSREVKLSKWFQEKDNPPGRWMWAIGCILTGLLAELDTLFCYDIVAGISRATKSVRGQKN